MNIKKKLAEQDRIIADLLAILAEAVDQRNKLLTVVHTFQRKYPHDHLVEEMERKP